VEVQRRSVASFVHDAGSPNEHVREFVDYLRFDLLAADHGFGVGLVEFDERLFRLNVGYAGSFGLQLERDVRPQTGDDFDAGLDLLAEAHAGSFNFERTDRHRRYYVVAVGVRRRETVRAFDDDQRAAHGLAVLVRNQARNGTGICSARYSRREQNHNWCDEYPV
jgi:hypothetical protein